MFLLVERLKTFMLSFGGWRLLFFLRLEVESFCSCLFIVEGFCCFFWMLKVLAHTFGRWKFLLLLFDVKGYCSYSWMFKVLTFGFRCWKFLLLLLDIEGFYFCTCMLKVLTFTLGCWRFFILGLLFMCIYIFKWCENIFHFILKLIVQV